MNNNLSKNKKTNVFLAVINQSNNFNDTILLNALKSMQHRGPDYSEI